MGWREHNVVTIKNVSDNKLVIDERVLNEIYEAFSKITGWEWRYLQTFKKFYDRSNVFELLSKQFPDVYFDVHTVGVGEDDNKFGEIYCRGGSVETFYFEIKYSEFNEEDFPDATI